jgi:transposase
VVTEDLEDLKQRLVVGRKRDGRAKYDEVAKAELVALCLKPQVSVARVARECGVNANQVARWLREHGQRGQRAALATAMTNSTLPGPAFVAVPVVRPTPVPAEGPQCTLPEMVVRARLPNGVAIDLRGVELRHIGEVIDALGSLRCSDSTKG